MLIEPASKVSGVGCVVILTIFNTPDKVTAPADITTPSAPTSSDKSPLETQVFPVILVITILPVNAFVAVGGYPCKTKPLVALVVEDVVLFVAPILDAELK